MSSLKVECPNCFGSLKLKDRSAEGKKVRCPKCQEVFKVELPEDDLVDDELDDFGDDFGDDELRDEEEDFPRKKGGSSKKSKKKKKSSASAFPLLIVAIAALGVVALGGAVFVISKFAGGGGTNKIDLTYLPSDSNMVMLIKVNEMFSSPVFADLVNQPMFQEASKQAAQNVGVEFKDFVSMTIGTKVEANNPGFKFSIPRPGMAGMPAPATATDAHTVVVLRSSTPLKSDEIATKMFRGTALTYAGKSYYKKGPGPFGSQEVDSLYFPEPTVAVFAMEADLKQVIDRGATQTRRREFDFVNPNQSILLAFAPQWISNPNAPLESPATMPNIQALEKSINKTFRAGAFGLRVTDHVDLEFVMKCADSAGAAEVKTATESNFADWKSQFEKSKTLLTLMDMNDLIALGDRTLASLTVTQSASTVTAVGTVPSDIKTVATSMVSKFSGMAGGMPGGGMSVPTGSGSASAYGLPNGGQLPPGALPPGGAFPPGAFPPGALPPGSLPPGTLPPGAIPPGGVLPPNGTAAPAIPGTAPMVPGGAAPAVAPVAPPTANIPATAPATAPVAPNAPPTKP